MAEVAEAICSQAQASQSQRHAAEADSSCNEGHGMPADSVPADPQGSQDICIRRVNAGHARHSMVTGRRHCSWRGTANLQRQQHPQDLVHVPANLSIIHQLQGSH